VLRRILAWLKGRRSRSVTPEDIEAWQEAKHVEDEVETTRVLGRAGPRAFTSDREWKGD
jgi:hypothetical protein